MNLYSGIQYFINIRTFNQALSDRLRDRNNPESGRITRADVRSIMKDTLAISEQLILNADLGKTYGSRIMVRNGVISQALYHAVKKFGADKSYATELCADVLWKLYKKQISIQRFLAHLMSRDPQAQMNICQKIFLFFPLAQPGYDLKINEIGSIASYDIFRCPVYDYFKTQSQEDIEFFKNSWCTFDSPLSEYLVRGGKYERAHTLSNGDDRCDMRWMAS